MAGRKLDSEAASMFEEEDFDAAYRGNVTATPNISNDADDDDDVEDTAASPEDDEAAWASAESEETTASDEETDEDEVDEVEEESEDDEEATEDDEDAEVSAAREILAKRSSTVAKKRGEGMTKAEMIRDEIEKRKKSSDSLRACDIIASLSDKGVDVNASQVSVTLRNMGVVSTRGPRAAKGEKAAAPTRGRKPKAETESVVRVAQRKTTEKASALKATHNGDAFTEADLTATAEFISAVGSADRGATLLRIFGRMNG
jgi:arginine repressor